MSQVPACPKCGQSNPYHRRPSVQDTGTEHEYRCENAECDHRFDDPVWRDPESCDCIPDHTLAAQLDSMKPDEVGL